MATINEAWTEQDAATVAVCTIELDRAATALIRREGDLMPVASDGTNLGPMDRPFGLTARLFAVSNLAVEHCRTLLGLAPDPVAGAGAGVTLTDRWTIVTRHAGRRLRANMTLRSVHLQDSIRLGAGLAAAVLAVGIFSLQHGFWVAFATLTVIKSNVRATGRRVGQAVAGTVIGFALASGLIVLVGSRTGVYVALLPVAIAVAIYANVGIGFAAGQAGFTITIVILFNLLVPSGWEIGLLRVEDVLAGGVVGLLVGVLAWPRGASASIGRATADLLDSASKYLVCAVTGLLRTAGPAMFEPDQHLEQTLLVTTNRQRAIDASLRADDVFAQLLEEHESPKMISEWMTLLSLGNRYWYVADILCSDSLMGTDFVPDLSALTTATLCLVSRCDKLAASLRRVDGSTLSVEPDDRTEHLPGDDLTAWIFDLAEATEIAPTRVGGLGLS